MEKFKKSWPYLLILIVMLVLQSFHVFDSVENLISDAYYQDGERVSPKIFVIGIDEETLAKYGSFDIWSREKTAELIELLTENKENAPAVIAVDVGFYGNKDKQIDDRLCEAVKNAGNVVLASSATFGNVAGQGNQVIVYEEPFEQLKNSAYGVGHTNVSFDDDGVVRHALGDIHHDGKTISSFGYEIYKAYSSYKNETADNSFGLDQFYINYSGKPRAYYGSVGAGCSFYKVLEGSYPVQAFKGNIVLIGAYASGTQDNYYSAIDKETQMYGVEIHANIVNQLLDGVYKKELVFPYNLISTILMGIFTIVIVSLFRNQISIPLVIILSGAYVYLSKLFYDKLNIVVAILAPVISALLIMIVHILLSYFTVHREKQRIIANYGKYLSPEVARQIADMGEAALSLGGIKKDIAVLFVDIRGFTPLSESLPPEKVMEMLNSYLKITTSAIFKYEGTVDKFIGDATMGVFNAPLDLEDYTYKAVMAGLEMAKMSKTIDETLPDDLKGRVGFGVGINCGEAIVGNVGTDFRMEYTAIGDTVNTASRLEGQAKAGTVIISQAVYERVKDRLICEDAGKVTLKGKAEEAQIYRVLGEK
ncbi:MAG: adenylate/guanylate cyclase domain-containing protein [Erysipelotrichaceae bacterium]|nr:adenylate/guanylate cyclase domain-containing protein [Erysipelotrichaceae bacterium]